ncbi:MAG: hypothetical protein GXO80_01420 [Chlorobi bacterium]|nr:hypothetical protein [Chlorobiota bacterium]
MRDERDFINGEKVKTYKLNIKNNFGNRNGECVYRSLEGSSNSLDGPSFSFDDWFDLNNKKLGVDALEVPDLVNRSGFFNSERIIPSTNNVEDVLKRDGRLLVATSKHMGMAKKIKIWESGKYKIWTSETSPVRILPRTITVRGTTVPGVISFSKHYVLYSFFLSLLAI